MSGAEERENPKEVPEPTTAGEHDVESPPTIATVASKTGRKFSKKATALLLDAIEEEGESDVEECLLKGANPNAKSASYWIRPPLIKAIKKKNPDLVKLLLEHDADPNVRHEDRNALHYAAEEDNVEIITLLLLAGADPNSLNVYGKTPLHIAIDEDHPEAAVALLEHFNVKTNIGDLGGDTALHLACAKGDLDVVRRLLFKGAFIDARNMDNELPLHSACSTGILAVVDELIANGAAVDPQDKTGRTPLYSAAAKGHIEIVERLVALKASVDMLDVNGETPLHVASANNREDVIEKLIEHGCPVNASSNDGSKPLHTALRFGASNAVDRLLEHGANLIIDSPTKKKANTIRILEPRWDDLLRTSSMGYSEGPVEVGAPGVASKSERKEVCEGLEGAVWPWSPFPFALATPTLQELIYGTPPVLTNISRKLGATWIHVPANNKEWIEDVYKALYTKEISERANLAISGSSKDRKEAAVTTSEQIGDEHKSASPDEDASSSSDPENDVTGRRPSQLHQNKAPKKRRNIEKRRKLLSILEFIQTEFDNVRLKTKQSTQSEREHDVRAAHITTKSSNTICLTDNAAAGSVFSPNIICKSFNDLFGGRRTRNLLELLGTVLTSRYQKLPIVDIDLRQSYYNPELARIVETKGLKAEEKGKTKKNPDDAPKQDSEALLSSKIKQYTIEESGVPTEMEKSYCKLMEDLRRIYTVVDSPVSLDEYYHESIDRDDLNVRNGDQVMSRFIARNRAERENIITQEDQQQGATAQNQVKTTGETLSKLEAGLGNDLQGDGDLPRDETPNFRQKILVVPRFWIWKVDDDTIVTSFPQRGDESGGLGRLPRAIWMELMDMVLKKQASDDYDGEVELDADSVLDGIVKACFRTQPTLRLMGKEYTFPDVFAAEIAYVSREVTKFYRHYKNSLGNSVEDFSRSIRQATECLIMVDDILNEMSMIRRVYRDQGRVMLNMQTRINHHGRSDTASSMGYNTEEWGYEGMRSTEDLHLIARLKHLETDAQMVREAITTLLDLRQRQVSIEMALSSDAQSETLFKQSSILFIFTSATVLFAPLSWVSSLMALKITGFSFDSWPISRVAWASFGSVLATIAVCATGLVVYLMYQNREMEKKKPKYT